MNPMNSRFRAAFSTVLVALGLSSAAISISADAKPSQGQMLTTSSGSFMSQMHQSMDVMDHDMMAAPMSGNPDHDFAAMMVPHHEGAIAMADAELLYGKNPILRRLAEEIVVTQRQEILVMQQQMARASASARANPSSAYASTAASPLHSRPAATAGIAAGPAVSSRDRVYSADQTSNTVSVINPATNALLGVIRLGDPAPGSILPLYKGQLLVHGLGFSPDHRTLAVISIGSNSVTLIDTATNTVKKTIYVGRSPHEGFFTPNGKELWVAVRGEDYVSVIDPVQQKEVRRVHTVDGPAMILFSPDGRYAYIPSSFTPELEVVDTHTYRIIARVPQYSPFSPNLAVSADGAQVWFTLKDTGRTQVISARPPFQKLATIVSGPITNHVVCVDNAHGHFAYVTVGGLNLVKVYSRRAPYSLVATIPTGDLPHGIWPSGDNRRVYIGLENGDAVSAIDTLTNKVLATVPIGQTPQAVAYVSNAVPMGTGTNNLVPLGEAAQAAHLTLVPPAGSSSMAHATVSVNSLGLVDLLQIAASGLEPRHEYLLSLAASPVPPCGTTEPLIRFKANAGGAQIAQTIGPLRKAITDSQANSQPMAAHYLILTPVGSDDPVLVPQP